MHSEDQREKRMEKDRTPETCETQSNNERCLIVVEEEKRDKGVDTKDN